LADVLTAKQTFAFLSSSCPAVFIWGDEMIIEKRKRRKGENMSEKIYDKRFICSCGNRMKESEMNTRHCPECDEWMHPNIAVMLVQKASGNHFSLEAEIADGERNFDHHGDASEQPAPCIDSRIPIVPDGSVIEITHLDADTLIGLIRMFSDSRIAEINPQRFHDYGQAWRFDTEDLNLMSKIDVNGSSFLPDNGLEVPVRQWMVGILQLLRKLNFPRWQGEDIDVTDIIASIISHSDENIIRMGKEEMVRGEKAYQLTLECKKNGVGFWHQKMPADSFDPSRPYADGYNIVVIYREQFKAIGLYANPKTEIVLGGREIAGIEFAGREQACGSPRGVEYSLQDANRVYEALKALKGERNYS